MIKKKIVWQADAFELVAHAGGGKICRAPAAMVFDPYQPLILVSRVYPEGCEEAACLASAVAEAIFTHGVRPDEVHVRMGKAKGLDALSRDAGFMLGLCDDLPELAAVKKELAEYMRSALASGGVC